MAKRKTNEREQFTMYLSPEMAALLEAAEEIWSYRSRAEFFEQAVRNQLGIELMGIKAVQKRIGRALDAHVTALRDL